MIALGQISGDCVKLNVHCKDTEPEPKDEVCEILLQTFPAASAAGGLFFSFTMDSLIIIMASASLYMLHINFSKSFKYGTSLVIDAVQENIASY